MVGTYQLLFYNRQTNLLYICIHTQSCGQVTQSSLTLRDPMNCNPPGSSVYEILQARTQEWVVISSPRIHTHTHTHTHTHIYLSSGQSFSPVWLFTTTRTAAHQASLSITNFRSLPKLTSTELVMPSNHLIFCRPLLLPPSIFSSIRVFSNESALRIRWSKYLSFSFNITPSNEYSGLIFRMDCTGWISLQSKGLSRIFSNTTVQKH